MKVYSPLTLIKPQFAELNGIQVLKPFKLETQHKPIEVLVKQNLDSNNTSFVTDIFECDNPKPVATHTYFIDKLKNVFSGLNIETDYYHQNRGYAELMRLISIMLMKENNLKSNNIVSRFEAVPFHLKYNFDIDGIQTVQESENWTSVIDALESCKKWTCCFDKKTAQEITDKSNQLLTRIESSSSSEQLEQDVCKFFEKFYKNINSKGSGQTFAEEMNYYNLMSNFYMSLGMDKIQLHSKFFNELFEKHGIDYKIL